MLMARPAGAGKYRRAAQSSQLPSGSPEMVGWMYCRDTTTESVHATIARLDACRSLARSAQSSNARSSPPLVLKRFRNHVRIPNIVVASILQRDFEDFRPVLSCHKQP